MVVTYTYDMEQDIDTTIEQLEEQITDLVRELKVMVEDSGWFVPYDASNLIAVSAWLKANVSTPWLATTVEIDGVDTPGIRFNVEADAAKFSKEF